MKNSVHLMRRLLSQRRAYKRIPLADNGISAPFFIVGSGRCGTTVLRRQLVECTRTYIPPETYVLSNVIATCRKLSHSNWPDVVCYVAGRFEYEPEFKRMGVETLQPFVERMRCLPEDQRSIARLVDALYRYLGESSELDFTAWGDKTPSYTFHMYDLAELYPNARFILMVRDGCDVVISMVNMQRYSTVESAARRWVEANTAARMFAQRHPEQVKTVYYENMVADPDTIISEISQFLALDPRKSRAAEPLRAVMSDAADLEHLNKSLSPIDTKSVGQGRLALDSNEHAHLGPIMNPLLKHFGYAPI